MPSVHWRHVATCNWQNWPRQRFLMVFVAEIGCRTLPSTGAHVQEGDDKKRKKSKLLGLRS